MRFGRREVTDSSSPSCPVQQLAHTTGAGSHVAASQKVRKGPLRLLTQAVGWARSRPWLACLTGADGIDAASNSSSRSEPSVANAAYHIKTPPTPEPQQEEEQQQEQQQPCLPFSRSTSPISGRRSPASAAVVGGSFAAGIAAVPISSAALGVECEVSVGDGAVIVKTTPSTSRAPSPAQVVTAAPVHPELSTPTVKEQGDDYSMPRPAVQVPVRGLPRQHPVNPDQVYNHDPLASPITFTGDAIISSQPLGVTGSGDLCVGMLSDPGMLAGVRTRPCSPVPRRPASPAGGRCSPLRVLAAPVLYDACSEDAVPDAASPRDGRDSPRLLSRAASPANGRRAPSRSAVVEGGLQLGAGRDSSVGGMVQAATSQDLAAEVMTLKKLLLEAQSREGELSQLLASRDAESADLRRQLAAAQGTAASATEENSQLQDQLATALGELQQAQQRLTQQQQEMESLRRAAQQAQTATQVEQNQHHQTFQSFWPVWNVMVDRTQAMQALSQLVCTYETQVTGLSEAVQQQSVALQQMCAVLGQRNADLQQSHIQVGQLGVALQQHTAALQQSRREVAQLGAALQQQTAALEQRGILVAHLSASLQQQNAELQQSRTEVGRLQGHVRVLEAAVNDVLASASGARVVGLGPVGGTAGAGAQGVVRTVQLQLAADSNPAQPAHPLVPPGMQAVVGGVVKRGDPSSPHELAWMLRAAQHAGRTPGAGQLLPRLLKVQVVGEELQYVMEAFQGSAEHLVYGQPLTMLQRVWLVVDLFAGVIGFHRDMGLAHGDIKPANMLYKHRNGRHRGTLCDAGLAMSGDTLAAYQRNGVGIATGTPGYMPPQYGANQVAVHQQMAAVQQRFGLEGSPRLMQILEQGNQVVNLWQAQGFDYFSAAVMALEMLLARPGDLQGWSRVWSIPGWLPLAPLLPQRGTVPEAEFMAALAEVLQLVDPWAPGVNAATLAQAMGPLLEEVPQAAQPLVIQLLQALVWVLRGQGQQGCSPVLEATTQLIPVLQH